MRFDIVIGEVYRIAASIVETHVLYLAFAVGYKASVVGHYRGIAITIIGLLAAAEQADECNH
jgi:hypothetical protein